MEELWPHLLNVRLFFSLQNLFPFSDYLIQYVLYGHKEFTDLATSVLIDIVEWS